MRIYHRFRLDLLLVVCAFLKIDLRVVPNHTLVVLNLPLTCCRVHLMGMSLRLLDLDISYETSSVQVH
jgi:hypothetical protein